MTINTPKVIKDFCSIFCKDLPKWKTTIIPRIITGILTTHGEPNFTNLARSLIMEKRNKATVMKFFRRKKFHSRQIYRLALRKLVKTCFRGIDSKPIFIAIDSTSTKRGGFTKILNAIKYKKKNPSNKGKSTKSHMFLMGIIILPNGIRLPLERKTYYTKEYCRQVGRKYVTLMKLMTDMIREAPIPRKAKNVIVLADEYFECRAMYEVCRDLKYSYIVPVDKRRCFADCQGKRLPLTLHQRGKHLRRKVFRKISLVESYEDTASYRRLSARTGRKIKRVYRAHTEVRSVARLGNVSVTYSWKTKKEGSRKKGESYKVLVCNNKSLSSSTIVEYYELRWQIEVFFREMKSDLGLKAFKGNNFESFERYVDMLLLGFLFLEWFRVKKQKTAASKKQKNIMFKARTRYLLLILEKEVHIESVAFIRDVSRHPRSKKYKLFLEKLEKAA